MSALCLPCEISLSLSFSVVYNNGHRILELCCPEGHDPRPDLTRGYFPSLPCWRLAGYGAGTPTARSGEPPAPRGGQAPRGTAASSARPAPRCPRPCTLGWHRCHPLLPQASPAGRGGLQQVRTPHPCRPNPLGRAA